MIPTRVVIKWLLKVMTRLLSDWLNYLTQLQFSANEKQNQKQWHLFTRAFSLPLTKLQAISRNSNWFIALLAPDVIGRGKNLVLVRQSRFENRSRMYHTLVWQSFPHEPSSLDSWCTRPCLFQQSRTVLPVLCWPCRCWWSVVWNFCPGGQKLINQSELSVDQQGKLLQCMFLLINNNYFLRDIFRMVRTFLSRLQLLWNELSLLV